MLHHGHGETGSLDRALTSLTRLGSDQDDCSKVQAVEGILAKAGVSWAEVCYMGDDVVDLGVMKRVAAGTSRAGNGSLLRC